MLSLAATLVVATAEHELPVGFEDDGGETVKVTWFDPPAAGKESDWVPVFGVVGSPVQFTSTFEVAPAGIVPKGRTATPMVAGPEPEEELDRKPVGHRARYGSKAERSFQTFGRARECDPRIPLAALGQGPLLARPR